MFGQQHMSPLQQKEKINVVVSLPTLSNQDGELHKEAVLSAHEGAGSRMLLFATMDGDYRVMW